MSASAESLARVAEPPAEGVGDVRGSRPGDDASAGRGGAHRDSGTGMRPGDRPILPTWLRAGVLAFVLAALGSALVRGPVGDPGGGTVAGHERGEVAASRALRFVDDAGGVVVLDAGTGAEIERIAPGEDGFVRSVMRGLANERKSRAIGPEAPFSLVLHADGSLWLDDPATDRHVVLSAFGVDNVSAFARLLGPVPATPAPDAADGARP